MKETRVKGFTEEVLKRYEKSKFHLIFYKNKIYKIDRSVEYPIKNYDGKSFFKGKYSATYKAPPNHPTIHTYKVYKFYLMAKNWEDLKLKIIQYYIKK